VLSKDATVYTNMIYSSSLIQRYTALVCVAVFEIYLYDILKAITLVCSFLELDVLYITIQNEFQWIGGDKNDMSAVHLDILTVTVSSLRQQVLYF